MDERGELAACVDGVPQLEVGERTDVLDGCPKTEAVAWFLRAMAPQVLITDELADASDAAAVLEAIYSGVPVLASAHGAGLHELAQRPVLAAMMSGASLTCMLCWTARGRGGLRRCMTARAAPCRFTDASRMACAGSRRVLRPDRYAARCIHGVPGA